MFKKRLISYLFIFLLNVPALIALSTCFENNFAYAGACPSGWSYFSAYSSCSSSPCPNGRPCQVGNYTTTVMGSPVPATVACCGPTPTPTPPPANCTNPQGNIGDQRCSSSVAGDVVQCQRISATSSLASWTTIKDCQTYETCQVTNNVGSCIPCTCTGLTYGQSRCNGNNIETCTAPAGISCSIVSSPCPSGKTCTGNPPTCTATPCIYCQTGLTVGESTCTTNGLLRVCQRNNGVCSNSDTACPNGGICVGNNSSVLTGGPPSAAQCSATPNCTNTAPGFCAGKPGNGSYLASGSCAAGTTQNGQCCCPTPYPSVTCNNPPAINVCPPGAAAGSSWTCCSNPCCPSNPSKCGCPTAGRTNLCIDDPACFGTSPTPTVAPTCAPGQIRCPAGTGACCTGTACNGSICVVATPTPTPNLCGPGNCSACITSCPAGCVIGRAGCTNPSTRKSESQKNLSISKNIEVKSQKLNGKKPKACSSFKLKLEKDNLGKTVIPQENICLNGGKCEEEDEICGVVSEEDPQTREEVYKCGCQKACEKLSPPNCGDGYAFPQVCGEVDDAENPGQKKCGVVEETLELDAVDSIRLSEPTEAE